MPSDLVFKQVRRQWSWHARRGGERAIGRVMSATIASGERYFLRLLLMVVKGATCYEYLRTYEVRELVAYLSAFAITRFLNLHFLTICC